MRHAWRFAAGAAAMLGAVPIDARLTRIVVESRETVPPVRPGAPAYLILRGHYEGAVDPDDRHNRIITDLAAAPRRADGTVGYSATFAIALPADRARANGMLWYDVPNRGNGTVAADEAGDIRVVSLNGAEQAVTRVADHHVEPAEMRVRLLHASEYEGAQHAVIIDSAARVNADLLAFLGEAIEDAEE